MLTAWRLRFTLSFVLVMIGANGLAGTLSGMLPPQALAAWGISHRALLDGEVFRLVTGTFLSHDLGMFLRQLGFAFAVIGAYEWLEGTWRAMAVFFSIDSLGSLLVLFVVLPILSGPASILSETELFVHDVGMSAGGFGLIGALVARHRANALLLALLLAGIGLKAAIAFEPIADTAHGLCLILGFGLQSILERRRERAC
jgi:hypothetical protein